MDQVVDRLAVAAERVLAVAGPGHDAMAFAFGDPGRSRWTYLPGIRPGVPLVDLDRDAAKAVHGLLAATVSVHTHVQIAAIMGLEDPLERLDGEERHAGDYWVAVYGTPGGHSWAWRLGGHHVSVRATVVAGHLRATPLFLGANPACVAHDGVVVSRPLAPEEELGFRLLAALGDAQRRAAVVAPDAPPDIVTGDAPFVGDLPPQAGVAVGSLDAEARALARRLVGVYLERLTQPLARHYLDEVLPDVIGDLHFAWAGATEPPAPGRPGRGHYYRLQGPRFLAELDNTQNGANHVHTVWRDPDGDHAADLL
ncbi:MAG: DUF3500 domain-containing protein [Actinobacteria bacterium]|jgi:hypothetical protein|nr:DUF3500 domain-containing protein [Actinomycetota bacterium]